MPFSQIPAAVIPLTVNGTATGTVTVAVADTPKVGTKCVLYSYAIAGAFGVEVVVTKVDAATGVVYLRPTPNGVTTQVERWKGLQYGLGNADYHLYLVADGAALLIEAQDIKTQPLYRGSV